MVIRSKSRRKNELRGIRASLNRFLSILFIVALGAGFLSGLFATSPDMFETADSYMDECALYDLDVKSTVGFSEADAEAARQTAGVAALQAARVLDAVLWDEDEVSYTARLYAIFFKQRQLHLLL